jgi:hypothetical protein
VHTERAAGFGHLDSAEAAARPAAGCRAWCNPICYTKLTTIEIGSAARSLPVRWRARRGRR